LRIKSDKKERTDDTNLEVITRATQKNFLLLRRSLFWRHPLFDWGKRRKREGKASGGGRGASEQSQRSIAVCHFLKGKEGEATAAQSTLSHLCSGLHEVPQCPACRPFLHNLRFISACYHHQCVCFYHPISPLPLNPI
jgi:hypothetical protein